MERTLSGREMSNSRAEEKEKTNQNEEKAIGGDHGKSVTKRTTETEKQVQTEQPEKSSEQKQKDKFKVYTPIVPFPQRIQKAKKEE